MTTRDDYPVGVADIALLLGVKAQTVSVWQIRGIFPAPEWFVSGVPAWRWSTVRQWAIETGRLPASAAGIH